MAHVDDGTLNALLDGELEAPRAAEVRAHLVSCLECSTRYEEAKRFLAQAADLLDAVVPPPLEARPQDTAPRPPAPAASPVRKVPKTAREVAIDIDGSTTKSPAIPPNFPRPDDPVPPPFQRPSDRWGQPLFEEKPARRARRLDLSTLAWAASVVLAVGLGYLAHDVYQGRRTPGLGERSLADAAPAAAPAGGGAPRAEAPTAAAPAARPARPSAAPSTRVKETRSVAANVPSGKSAAEALRAAGAATRNVVAAAPGAAAPAPAAAAPAAEQRLADAAPRAPAAAPRAQLPAAVDRAEVTGVSRAAPAAAAEAPAAGVAAFRAPATFRAIDFDQAAAALSGTARWIEGLSLRGVKIGPGTLVQGADPTRQVVRVVYADVAGRFIQLDQQRLASRRTAPEGLGLTWGDTLTTAVAGGTRVRWLDREGLWMSLTGSLPADTLRALLARVR